MVRLIAGRIVVSSGAVLSRSPVLFSNNVARNDDALGIFRDYDEPSYEDIRRNFAYWDHVEIVY